MKSLGGFQIIVNLLSRKKRVRIEFDEKFRPELEGSLGDPC